MRYLIPNLLLLLSISTTYTACTLGNKVKNHNTTDKNYQYLSEDKLIKNYVGQKIWLEGKESTVIHQHMMKPSFSLSEEDKEKHLYVDYNNGQQIVVYYTNINIPKDQKKHQFYGTVQKMSGAGKGGGTYTEYYLDLDKVE